MAGRVSDVYFMNGNSLEKLKQQIDHVKSLAKSNGRDIQFGVNGFVIVRDTEEEAKQVLKDIILHADKEAVEGFKSQVKFAGQSSLKVKECGKIHHLKTLFNTTMDSAQD